MSTCSGYRLFVTDNRRADSVPDGCIHDIIDSGMYCLASTEEGGNLIWGVNYIKWANYSRKICLRAYHLICI